MSWGSFWFVVSGDSGSGEPWVFSVCCHCLFLWTVVVTLAPPWGEASGTCLPSPPIVPPFRYIAFTGNKVGLLLMNQNDELELSAQQTQYLDWLCTAPSERVPPSKHKMAVHLGVNETTLRRWEKREPFLSLWKAKVDDIQGSPERTQRLLDTLYSKALEGDTKSAQLYLQATNRMAPATVTVQSSKQASQLSDEELDQLIAAVAEREKSARAQLRVV